MLNNILLEKVALPLGDVLTGGSFCKELKKLREQDKYSEKEIEKLQVKKLDTILHFALSNCNLYKDINIKENNPEKLLKHFPILTKELIHSKTDELLTKNKNDLIKQSSSGSSGLQTVVYFDKKEQSIQRAYQIRWWEWAGYKIGSPLLQTGITPKRGVIKKIKDVLFKTYYLPAFAHSEKEVMEALKWAKKKENVTLAGYASSLYVISKMADKNSMNFSFKTAISWGDKLFQHYNESIKKSFNVKVHETYASSEGFMIASKKDLDFLYIMSPNVYVEIVDDDGNEVEDGEMGHVLVTKLDSFSMPMIRYKIGDLAIKLPREKYPKNRELPYPLLEKIVGRDTDLIKTRTGKFMVVHSFTGIIEHFEDIEQYSVIQRELEGIEIEYIPSNNFNKKVLSKIKLEILNYLNEDDFEIKFTKVNEIKPTLSGKPQIIRSYIKKDNL